MDRMPQCPFTSVSKSREFADQNGLMTDEQIAKVYREPDGRQLTEATVQRTRRLAEAKLRKALRGFALDVA